MVIIHHINYYEFSIPLGGASTIQVLMNELL